MNYKEISDRLLKLIGKADEEFQDQIAKGIGINREELLDYVDNADFVVIGNKQDSE